MDRAIEDGAPEAQGAVDQSAGADLASDLLSAASEISDLVADVCSTLEQAESGTTAYVTELDDIGADLADPELTAIQLKEKVYRLLTATFKVAEENHELQQSLTNVSNDAKRLQDQVQKLQHEKVMDPLTNVYNRAWFDEALKKASLEADSEGEALALLLIEVDQMNQFLELYGQRFCDTLLKLVATTISDNTKRRDTVARFSNTQFAVILPETTLGDAQALSRKLLESVAKKKIIKKNTNKVVGNISVSVGAAERTEREPASAFVTRLCQVLASAMDRGEGPARALQSKVLQA